MLEKSWEVYFGGKVGGDRVGLALVVRQDR